MHTLKTASDRKRICSRFMIWATALLVGAVCVCALAQQSQPSEAYVAEESVSLLSVENLDARIKQLKEARDKQENEEQKKQIDNLIDIFERARAQLLEAQKSEAAFAEFQKARQEAPQRLTVIKTQLDQMATEPQIDESFKERSLADIEQHVKQLEAELANAKKNAADRELEAKARTERRTEIPQASVRAKEQLESLKRDLSVKAGAEAPAELAEAKRILLLSTQKALQKKIESYAEETLSYEARGDLLEARRNLAARQVTCYEKLLKQWQDILDKRRKMEAEQAAEKARQARREAARAHPAVRQLAEENARLAELRTGPRGLVAINAVRVSYQKEIDKHLTDLRSEFDSVREKVKAAGLTDVIGEILLSRRNSLPDVREHERNIRTRRSETARARFEWIGYDEQYAKLADLERSVDSILKELGPALDQDQRQEIEPEIRKLLETKRQLLKALVGEYENYLGNLADLDVRERQLVANVHEYAGFIDENILWVKSTRPLGISTLPQAWETLGWLAAPQNWYRLLKALGRDFKTSLFQYAIGILLFAGLFVIRGRLGVKMGEIAVLLHNRRTDRFTHTVKVFLITCVLAVISPALLFFIGWRLGVADPEAGFVNAVAAGLRTAALFYLVLGFLRLMSVPKGLAVEHFRISEKSMTFFRRHISWFTSCIVPLAFVVTTVEQRGVGAQQESLGRLAFMAKLIIVSVFFAIVVRPSAPLMKELLKRNRGGWLDRLRLVWFPVSVLLPSTLALLAALGYHYAAQRLNGCLLGTIMLVLGAILFFALIVRWLTVAQNRIALEKERQRAAAAAAAKGAGSKPLDTHEEADGLPEPQEDPYRMSLQVRRFMRALLASALVFGLWLIWNEMLPALNILNRVELWKTTVGDISVPVTLADLIIAAIIILVTIVAVRNILGLLEIMVLGRLPLDRGVRFAIVTLSRYVIVIVGLVLALGRMGLGWSKVQWLVAATGVGLGFGLQEIFANFVCGLIILFEQPIRVGDVVTVGDVSGRVTRIKIRATTIQKWDRRELVVPNKEFITGRLINWTLSDTILRMDFAVGIAYGSDTALAEKVLLEVARENQKVMRDPSPFVLFKAFGDSALEFELRLYIPDLDSYLTVWHEINRAIDDAFRNAGIEIAFPQRDIHIRSAKSLIPVAMRTEERRGP